MNGKWAGSAMGCPRHQFKMCVKYVHFTRHVHPKAMWLPREVGTGAGNGNERGISGVLMAELCESLSSQSLKLKGKH